MRWNPNGDDSRPVIEDTSLRQATEEAKSYRMSTYAWSPLPRPTRNCESPGQASVLSAGAVNNTT